MPLLTITNLGTTDSGIHEPWTLFQGKLPAGETKQFTIESMTLLRLEKQLNELRARTDNSGNPLFTVSTAVDRYTSSVEGQVATADVTRWAANHVASGLAIEDPTTPSVVATRRVNVDAGEIYVDGKHFVISLAADSVLTAQLDLNGDVLVGSLDTASDRYAHVVAVNDAGTYKALFIFGEPAAIGEAEPLTEAQLAVAVGNYLGEAGPVYAFVLLAEVLFSEDSGLTQTTTSVRAVPPSYS